MRQAQIAGKSGVLDRSDEQINEALPLRIEYPQMPMDGDDLIESAAITG